MSLQLFHKLMHLVERVTCLRYRVPRLQSEERSFQRFPFGCNRDWRQQCFSIHCRLDRGKIAYLRENFSRQHRRVVGVHVTKELPEEPIRLEEEHNVLVRQLRAQEVLRNGTRIGILEVAIDALRTHLSKPRAMHHVDDRQRLVGRVRVVLLDSIDLLHNTIAGGLTQEVCHVDCVCALRSRHFELFKAREVRIEWPLDRMRCIQHLFVLFDLAPREVIMVELEIISTARSSTNAFRNLAHFGNVGRRRRNP